MSLQLNILILSLGAVQGILISLFLLRSRSKQSSNVFLTLFIIVVSFQLLFKILSKTWLWDNALFSYLFSYSLPFLTGPLIFLFVRSSLHSSQFLKSDFLHFIPFLLNVSHHIVRDYWDFQYLPDSVIKLIHWQALQLISLLVYGIISWRLLNYTSMKIDSRGLKRFLIWVVSAESIVIITIALMIINYQTFPDVRVLFVVLTFLIYWITYRSMLDFKIEPAVELTIPTKKNTSNKYAHSGLKSTNANQIVDLLNEAIRKDKIYIEPDLTIEKVAEKLGVAKHHLSQVLNEYFGKSYLDFINEARLVEAQLRLADPKCRKEKISAIAHDCGFSSVASFNKIFKRQYNITPTQFRDREINDCSLSPNRD